MGRYRLQALSKGPCLHLKVRCKHGKRPTGTGQRRLRGSGACAALGRGWPQRRGASPARNRPLAAAPSKRQDCGRAHSTTGVQIQATTLSHVREGIGMTASAAAGSIKGLRQAARRRDGRNDPITDAPAAPSRGRAHPLHHFRPCRIAKTVRTPRRDHPVPQKSRTGRKSTVTKPVPTAVNNTCHTIQTPTSRIGGAIRWIMATPSLPRLPTCAA